MELLKDIYFAHTNEEMRISDMGKIKKSKENFRHPLKETYHLRKYIS